MTTKTEEKEETTEEKLTRLERKLIYMRAEIDGMEAREEKRKRYQQMLAIALFGFCYGVIVAAILDL